MNKILKENNKRNEELFTKYDPFTGEGSLIPRFPYYVYHSQKKPIYIPESMISLKYISKGSILEDCLNFDKVLLRFINDRLDHDFEFWASQLFWIKDKESAIETTLILRKSQRKILKELEEDRISKVPIRVILDKTRQLGGSTLIQAYFFWIQTRHQKNWNSTIVADVESQSNTLRGMYSFAVGKMAKDIQPLSIKNYEGQGTVKNIPETGAIISVASMQKPDKIRSQDIKLAHLSEVAFWKKTDGKQPKDVVQSIIGSIPSIPNTALVMESTAKGVGNFFHSIWLGAMSGQNAYKPIFIAWYEVEMYREEFDSDEEKLEFFKSLNEYEKYLWEEIGATLEGIKWYRNKLKEFEGDTWRMGAEFPTTWQESFQSTGRRAFPPQYTKNLEATFCDPIFIGDIHGDSKGGEKALNNIELVEEPNGRLHIWNKPNDPEIPKGYIMSNRYCVVVDVGGSSKSAHPSAITVYDRYYMMDDGIPEAIATWHGRMDKDLVAWKAAQIAKIYDNALLVIEVNFFTGFNANDEGSGYYTTLDEIAPHYKNLYSRTHPDQIKEGYPIKYGFHMNKLTKPEIIDHFKKMLREQMYIEYDKRVKFEADAYEIKDTGVYGPTEGMTDDLLDTRMIGGKIIYQDMKKPALVEIKNSPAKDKVNSAASF